MQPNFVDVTNAVSTTPNQTRSHRRETIAGKKTTEPKLATVDAITITGNDVGDPTSQLTAIDINWFPNLVGSSSCPSFPSPKTSSEV